MYIRSKKIISLINSNTNYRREMNIIPINMDYCLPQFDADALIFATPNLTAPLKSSALKLTEYKVSHF